MRALGGKARCTRVWVWMWVDVGGCGWVGGSSASGILWRCARREYADLAPGRLQAGRAVSSRLRLDEARQAVHVPAICPTTRKFLNTQFVSSSHFLASQRARTKVVCVDKYNMQRSARPGARELLLPRSFLSRGCFFFHARALLVPASFTFLSPTGWMDPPRRFPRPLHSTRSPTPWCPLSTARCCPLHG